MAHTDTARRPFALPPPAKEQKLPEVLWWQVMRTRSEEGRLSPFSVWGFGGFALRKFLESDV